MKKQDKRLQIILVVFVTFTTFLNNTVAKTLNSEQERIIEKKLDNVYKHIHSGNTWELGVKECKEFLVTDSKNVRVYEMLGWAYFLKGNDAIAHICWQKALEINPSNKWLLKIIDSNKSNSNQIQKSTESIKSKQETEDYFKQLLLELKEDNLTEDEYLKEISLLMIEGYYELTEIECQKFIKKYPNNAKGYKSLASCYLSVGNYKSAIINWEKSLKLCPDKKLEKFVEILKKTKQ
jgi:tetratricopeptide (TPR) repeat protein